MVIGTKIAQWTLSTKISQEQYYLSKKELLARLTGLLVELNRFKCHGIKSMTFLGVLYSRHGYNIQDIIWIVDRY